MGYEGDLEFDGDVKKIRHCLYKCAASHPTMIIKDTGITRSRNNGSAVPMHFSFGRRYRSAIRSMRLITGNCMPYLEEQTNVKSQIDGNKE